MSKFQVGDEVECRFRIYPWGIFAERGVVIEEYSSIDKYYVRTGSDIYSYKGYELTLIIEDLENV